MLNKNEEGRCCMENEEGRCCMENEEGENNKGKRGERRESIGERREKCQILKNGGKMVERAV